MRSLVFPFFVILVACAGACSAANGDNQFTTTSGHGGAGAGSGSGGEAGDGTAATDKFQSSALGGMMSMFGGGGGAADSAQGAQTGGFIQAQYTLIQNVLKASVRKITLTVSWSTGIHDEQVDFILYVTDPAGMQKALPI